MTTSDSCAAPWSAVENRCHPCPFRSLARPCPLARVPRVVAGCRGPGCTASYQPITPVPADRGDSSTIKLSSATGVGHPARSAVPFRSVPFRSVLFCAAPGLARAVVSSRRSVLSCRRESAEDARSSPARHPLKMAPTRDGTYCRGRQVHGKRFRAVTWMGRTTVKWRRSRVATSLIDNRSAAATTELSTDPNGRSL